MARDAMSPETDEGTIPVSRLRAEIGEESTSSRSVEAVTSEVESVLFESEPFSFEERHVKSSLADLLVGLVAMRDSDTHGKQLLDDLETEFDTSLSPGTVYPQLHELCDDGLLEQRELVQTKEYAITDDERARERLRRAARQHLALGMLFRTAIERTDLA